jgi:hypothetical protein
MLPALMLGVGCEMPQMHLYRHGTTFGVYLGQRFLGLKPSGRFQVALTRIFILVKVSRRQLVSKAMHLLTYRAMHSISPDKDVAFICASILRRDDDLVITVLQLDKLLL